MTKPRRGRGGAGSRAKSRERPNTTSRAAPQAAITINDVIELVRSVLLNPDNRFDDITDEVMEIVATGLRRAGHLKGLTLNEIDVQLGDVRKEVLEWLDRRFREELRGVRYDIESTVESLLEVELSA
jgi:hypothetical protein